MTAEQPIHVRVAVGDQARELTIVADPLAGFTAIQVGDAVAVALLEMGAAGTKAGA